MRPTDAAHEWQMAVDGGNGLVWPQGVLVHHQRAFSLLSPSCYYIKSARARSIHYCHDIVSSNSSGCYGPRAVCGGPHDRMDPSSDIRVWDRLNQSIV